MVAVNVGKPQLGVVRGFLCFIGSEYDEIISYKKFPIVSTDLTKH